MTTRIIAAAVLISLLETASELQAMPEDGCFSERREAEQGLLHRRVNLSGVVQKTTASASWQPLRLPAAPVIVLNLWSRSCKPCLEELPVLGQLMAQHPGVPFVFAADPPEETSRDDIVRLWARSIVDLPPGHCQKPIGEPPVLGGPLACHLFLPDVPLARSENTRLVSSLDGITARPVTLLLDGSGVVRQVFVGSVLKRIKELDAGIKRLGELQTARAAAGLPARH